MKQPWELAMECLGIPFLHMGRSRKGMDCVGVIKHVCDGLGMVVEDSPFYGREPARNNNSFQLEDYLTKAFGPAVNRRIRPNDVVMMKLRPRFAPHHVGMVAPHPYGLGLVHSYGEVQKVVFHRIDEVWNDRIVKVFACPPAQY